MRFVSIRLVKAGWLSKDKGKWRLTEEGRAAYEQFREAEQIENETRRRYREWQAQQPSAALGADEEAEDVEAAQLESDDLSRRAWLVRGANVDGVNVLPLWFSAGYCSVGWHAVGDIPAGTLRLRISEALKQAFPDASPQSRGVAVGNLNRFINDVSVGDLVVTVDGAKVYVGEIDGEPTFTGDERVTRQRSVSWTNLDTPFARSDLSAEARDGLGAS